MKAYSLDEVVSSTPYHPTEFQCMDCGKVQAIYNLSDPEYYRLIEETKRYFVPIAKRNNSLIKQKGV